jgi:copper(I)-binding protein
MQRVLSGEIVMKNIATIAALLLAGVMNASQAAGNATIEVTEAYARAVPPSAPNSAAFMVINNHGDADRQLVSAESDVSKVTELHNHINDNGVMRMRQVPQITAPAKGSVELKPGSFHVMLIGLNQPLNEGDEVNLKLTFDDGSEQQLAIKAKKMMHKMKHHHAHH